MKTITIKMNRRVSGNPGPTLIRNGTYIARDAVDQPEWKAQGRIYACREKRWPGSSCAELLLKRGDYTVLHVWNVRAKLTADKGAELRRFQIHAGDINDAVKQAISRHPKKAGMVILGLSRRDSTREWY